MPNVDTLITLIRDSRQDEALTLLAASPGLATAHSHEDGQLHGASPLHWAGHRNLVQVAERLIELGANVNDSASDWWLTPLAWAADAGSAQAVELLLKHGADVNQDAIVGTTALHAVAMGGSSRGSRDPEAYRRTAEILIAHGADVNWRASGDRGQTPLDDAVANGNEHVAAVLRAHGARVSASQNAAGIRGFEDMPAELQAALREVHEAVQALNHDHMVAVSEQSFELAASLRDRAAKLKRRIEEIMRDWERTRAVNLSNEAHRG